MSLVIVSFTQSLTNRLLFVLQMTVVIGNLIMTTHYRKWASWEQELFVLSGSF